VRTIVEEAATQVNPYRPESYVRSRLFILPLGLRAACLRIRKFSTLTGVLAMPPSWAKHGVQAIITCRSNCGSLPRESEIVL
ncbi:MAG: hypothetical protein ACREA9_24260, partial [Pyrinomonadaceae bacterium]